MRTKTVLVMLLTLGAIAQAGARDWPAMRNEADKGLPPWIQYYNRLKGEPRLGPFDQHLSEPESLNVRLVGKWGRGPAARVTGRDTLVYLALGSEVAIFNCVNAHNPTIVNEIQCRYVVDRAILKDSLLYCVLQGEIEVFNIANPANVTRIRYFPISAVDMCIQDSLAYTISADSFTVYQLVSPDSILRLGACADSGYYIAADSGFAYLCDRWGLYVIDATDPVNPHQATIMSSGVQTGEVLVDSGLCYYFEVYPSGHFVIANVADPYHPSELNRTSSIGFADMYKIDFYLYLSTYQIVDVSNPASPTVISSLQLPANQNSVWTRSPYSYSFVADDYNGLATINITDPVHPALDTVLAGANEAYDVCTGGGVAYVADNYCGMKVVDLGVVSSPREVGSYDTIGEAPHAQAVAARDSFAYLPTQFPSTVFRVMDVSSPANPRLAAWRYTGNGRACVLRDTLAYVAEDGQLVIFSIANPRNPRLVGSCVLVNSPWGLWLVDSLAYVSTSPAQIVNVKDPAHPVVIGIINNGDAYGICVQDTIALVGGLSKLDAVSVANPASPRVISSYMLPGEAFTGIVVDGHLAYVGTAGGSNVSKLRVMDVSRPDSMRCIGYHSAPTGVRQVCLHNGLAYAACYDAGVCIFETTSTSAIAEASPVVPMTQAIALTPNPASSFVNIREEVSYDIGSRIRFYDAAGREVLDVPFVSVQGRHPRSQQIDISALPDGCYFVKVAPAKQDRVLKLVKFEGR